MSSWIRTAVNRAVEVGGKSNLTRTVRNYADTVVLHAGNAVAEGAKLIQDRIGARNIQSFRLTMKRLEEVSVSCRGIERVQLLRRWLVALKETERLSAAAAAKPNEEIFSDDSKDSPRKPSMVYYVDPDLGTMNFCDVFLYSQALEGITLSMVYLFCMTQILEAPNEEEVSLLLEIFGLCLAEGQEIHKALMSSIQDLATAFSEYQDEVLVKREELLQYAQGAIAGLKINADIARIDAQACKLMEKLDKMKTFHHPSNEAHEKSSEEALATTEEDLKETLGQIQLCSMLEALLLKKKSLSNGDSPDVHAEKVDKLKILSESLLGSTSKAEKRILDHRSQKEEALNFRVAKANEVSQIEKELTVEIGGLEKQKDELEAELKRVSTSLTVARARLHNAREERDQFDEASNQILIHLKAKEDELSRSITSCRVEADVVNAWVNFLEDTWVLQTKYTEQKERKVNGDLEKYRDYFVNLVLHLLTTYKEQLGSSVTCIKLLAGDLHSYQGSETATIAKDEGSEENQRGNLEEEYLDIEAKFLTTLSIVDTMKKQFYAKKEGICRKDEERIKELFNDLEKIKEEYECIERPVLDIETRTQKLQSPVSESSHGSPPPTSKHIDKTSKNNKGKKNKSSSVNREKAPATHMELEKLASELESDGRSNSSEEIGEWEFDELEKELKVSS